MLEHLWQGFLFWLWALGFLSLITIITLVFMALREWIERDRT